MLARRRARVSCHGSNLTSAETVLFQAGSSLSVNHVAREFGGKHFRGHLSPTGKVSAEFHDRPGVAFPSSVGELAPETESLLFLPHPRACAEELEPRVFSSAEKLLVEKFYILCAKKEPTQDTSHKHIASRVPRRASLVLSMRTMNQLTQHFALFTSSLRGPTSSVLYKGSPI